MEIGQPDISHIDDPDLPEQDRAHMERYGAQTILYIPLHVEGRLVGFTEIWESRRKREFTPEEIALCEAIAQQAAIAIRNAQQVAALAEERKRLALLHRLGERLSASLDIHTVAQQALDDVRAVVGALRGIIFVWDSDAERLLPVAVSGYDAESLASLQGRLQLPLGEGSLTGWVAANRQSVVVADVAADERWLPMPGFDDWVRSVLSVPLISREELVGVMSMYSEQEGFFGEDHRILIESAAATIAAAVANARLYDAARKRAQQLAIVAQIAEQIISILEPEALLQTVVERIVEGFGYEYAAILLLDPETDELVFVTGAGVFAGLTPEGYRQKLKEGMVGWAAYLGETLLANDVSRESRYIAPFLHETRSELDVPLKRGGRVIGVLDIQSRRLNAFDAQDVQAMEALAGHIATAIENARLHAELQAYAEELERRVEERTAELRRERERVQAILDATGEGVFVTDLKGCIEYMNPAAERMTGFRLEELRGHRLWEICAADEEQMERMRPMAQALRSGETWRGEAVLCRKDGSVCDVAIVAASIPGEGGQPSGYVGVIEDITPFRELDRLKSQFIRNISHEFRTPLAAAKLYIELARRQPDRQAEHLDAADAQLDHLTALVEDILEVARIDAEGVTLERRVVSLNDLIASVAEQHRVLAEDKGLRMECHLEEPDLVVEVDPEQIGRVVSNLLSNAIRYTPSGGQVEIAVGIAEAKGQTWATITVSDTGIGIPEDEIPYIFDRFFRGTGPRQMQVPGTGLGLAIVKEVVEMHEGFVTLESEVGKGSTFMVWLPIAGD